MGIVTTRGEIEFKAAQIAEAVFCDVDMRRTLTRLIVMSFVPQSVAGNGGSDDPDNGPQGPP